MHRCGADVRELLHDGCTVACVDDAPFSGTPTPFTGVQTRCPRANEALRFASLVSKVGNAPQVTGGPSVEATRHGKGRSTASRARRN
jgi:hypothetical protein